jgi:hypothetical protein
MSELCLRLVLSGTRDIQIVFSEPTYSQGDVHENFFLFWRAFQFAYRVDYWVSVTSQNSLQSFDKP